jgi:hypoxanthine phosphoribosyltransferase
MKSYDYAHRQGVLQISWEDFGQLAARLVEMVSPFRPEIILGIARAGLFPATAIACMLQKELYPVRITRRFEDQVVYPQPVWRVPVPGEVAGKVVMVVDEIADTGETLALVAEAAANQGAAKVITACLASHNWARPAPDIAALVSDAFIIFPWDQQRYIDGKWQVTPEVAAGLQAQSQQER